jgi:hypothetical protein
MHLLQSARVARASGLDEKVVVACLLHDIAIAGLLSASHGYWDLAPGHDQRHLLVRPQRDRLRRVRGRGRPAFPAARGGARVRRLPGGAHVADDDLPNNFL